MKIDRALAEFNLEQIFDPFKRCFGEGLGETNDASLGLGLYIVREVARAHGGDVEVRSAEGVTVFNVLLPRNNESTASSEVPTQPDKYSRSD